MKLISRYKKYTSISSFLRYCPKRILAFKRPKWQKLQRVLTNTNTASKNLKGFSQKSVVTFNDNSLIKNFETKSWKRNKTSYSDGLTFKTSLYLYYNSAVTTPFFKKTISSRKFLKTIPLFATIFLKPLFTLEILLWKLGFFESVHLVRQMLHSQNIFVNHILVKSTLVLKKGDLITFVDSTKTSSLNNKKMFELFSLFFEIDYYTNSIIVLKHFTDLARSDFYSMGFDPVKLKAFVDYIKMK